MQKLAGDHEDINGNLARWLLCAVKAPPRYLNFDDAPDSGISSLLETLYRNLEKLPVQDYLIDKDSQAIFKSWQNYLVDAEREENHPGLKLIYPKIEAYTARLALWLHCINAILAGEIPAPSIPGTTMQKAVELALFFLGQAKLVYAVNSPQSGLTGRLLKLFKFAEGKQKGITPRQVRANNNYYKSAKIATSEIRRDCLCLVDRGYFRREGDTFFVDDVNLLVAPPTGETPITQTIAENIVGVGDFEKTTSDTEVALPREAKLEQPTKSQLLSTTNTTNKVSETLVEVDVDAVGDLPLTTTNLQQHQKSDKAQTQATSDHQDLWLDAIPPSASNLALHTPQLSSVEAADDNQWLTPECLQGMAADLEGFQDDPEALADLRQCWPQQALEAACELLKPETRQRIMQWMLD